MTANRKKSGWIWMRPTTRERPGLAAAEVVDDDELVVLEAKLAGHDMKPTDTVESCNLHGFVVDVGRLAGFHPRRSQPLPGVSKLWKVTRSCARRLTPTSR